MTDHQILEGDALTRLRETPDASVDLIATDPPYFRMKKESWDRQWDNEDRFLEWIGTLADEWRRVLRPNGSLYVFASPKMAWGVEGEIRKRFEVLNHLVWKKERGRAESSCKESLRQFFGQSERIIFAQQSDHGWGDIEDRLRGEVFEPLRAYLDGERRRAGIDKADCNAACGFSRSAGGMASRHYFSRSQWQLPTAEHYAALQRLFGPEYLTRPYEELRREYEERRREYEERRREYEELRRPFSVSADVPYTDVWDFPTVKPYQGKHVCEKPVAMMEHIVRSSSRPGAIVLDCFAGSGVTGEAALNLGRRFVGIEIDPAWVRRSQARLNAAASRLPFADAAE